MSWLTRLEMRYVLSHTHETIFHFFNIIIYSEWYLLNLQFDISAYHGHRSPRQIRQIDIFAWNQTLTNVILIQLNQMQRDIRPVIYPHITGSSGLKFSLSSHRYYDHARLKLLLHLHREIMPHSAVPMVYQT